ncbi:MAG: AI-2E family transporter [Pseudoflavonifractor capillosus]|uniref:AI-2E family transporter n=1 Tax=Pseudoflavonifractor capillosus TaxID=106588 RepID=UPI0023F91301|nr:AI-2E family transporter [Pseudoflavonifractor capillosus]MCI5929444.1 AI-2E family transporter [Pseudoflavonifractor capillosus]MDY4662568.1 AI-2E family transporter [Pseudoflavonifractor capillosus]
MDKKLFKSILWIITYAVLLVLFIIQFDEVRGLFWTVIGLFQPLFIGFAIAFVLNRPCQLFSQLYDRGLGRTKAKNLSRPLAVATSYLLMFVLIIAFFSLVLPKLVESIQIFLNSINGYMLNIQEWLNKQEWLAPLFSSLHLDTLDLSNFSDLIKGALNGVVNTLTTAVPQLLTITSNIISIVVTGFLSIIFSVYMLSGKATLLSQCRRVLKAYAPPKVEAWVTDVVHLTANTFTAFVSGQLIEACILGGLTALGMLFIQADYAPLIGVIVGATALIPMVGAFLGGAVAAVLLIMVSPLKTLIFLIFLLCLQQFEGNVIYPRVVGNNVGLPAIWVLAAVTVGGGLFQFVGILVSVPVASVLYTLLRRDVHRRLGESKA